MWANDYPHAEGSLPHSAAAIERQMQHLNDDRRARILCLNCAKIFKFDVDRLLTAAIPPRLFSRSVMC
jgi:predicted TIM-barrel fold metal-dependent hydrolase